MLKKLAILFVVLVFVAGIVSAQEGKDWRSKSGENTEYNCTVLEQFQVAMQQENNGLLAVLGESDFIRVEDGTTFS